MPEVSGARLGRVQALGSLSSHPKGLRTRNPEAQQQEPPKASKSNEKSPGSPGFEKVREDP